VKSRAKFILLFSLQVYKEQHCKINILRRKRIMGFYEAMEKTVNGNNNISVTENGAIGYRSTGRSLLDLNFSTSSLRNMDPERITSQFSQACKEGSEYCDQCSDFRLLPDPDPYDWFRDGDMKAVCLAVNGVIRGALERPSECVNIRKPLYCPKIGRELSDEEKKEAAEQLEWAQKYVIMR